MVLATKEMALEGLSGDIDKLPAEAAYDYAKRALPLMTRYGVKPTPKNYAVWYVYVAAGHEMLVREIETMISERITFTEEVNEYLYNTYISDANSVIIKQTTQNAHRVLAEILQAINSFSGDTQAQQAQLASHMGGVEGAAEGDLKTLAEQIIQSVASMKESGGRLEDRLEDSREEIHQLRQNLARITTESERDFLTGLYNRKALDQKLDRALQQAAQEGHSLCLLMLDIDHFKAFNDNYGHLIGDEVLKIVSKTMIDCVKGMDIVARYGGEEFCVLLPSTPLGGAMIVAENLRKAIASRGLKHRDSGEEYGRITVSIGVAMYRPETDTQLALIKRADDALYRAKKSGRNCVTQERMSKG